jgi:hypothetical protein
MHVRLLIRTTKANRQPWYALGIFNNHFPFFDAKGQARHPTLSTYCLASSFIAYWAGIHKQEEKAMLETGAEAMKATALHFHSMQDSETGAMVLCFYIEVLPRKTEEKKEVASPLLCNFEELLCYLQSLFWVCLASVKLF